MSVIGIPKALYYHKYGTLWCSFFEELGEEIVFSANSDRSLLEQGIGACVGEACLPLKAWFGHALDVAPRSDWLFAPSYMSVHHREYICPKFGGLPDMARPVLRGVRLLSPEVNRHDRDDGGMRAALEAGRALGYSSKRARNAYSSAVQTYLNDRCAQVAPPTPPAAAGRPVVLLMGHSYMLGDGFLSMDVAGKLRRLGATVRRMESFDARELRLAAAGLEKPLFWTYGTQALGCVELARRCVDGVVYITCFGCGVDSFVAWMAERRLREAGVPFALLSLDEHTAQAGVDTRLEAFVDTLDGHRREVVAR